MAEFIPVANKDGEQFALNIEHIVAVRDGVVFMSLPTFIVHPEEASLKRLLHRLAAPPDRYYPQVTR